MTCSEYDALLAKLAEGTLTPEEEDLLLAHEASCPACAARREALDALPEHLAALARDVPPMPADFHQGWTTRVEECAMEDKQAHRPIRVPSRSKTWTRVLSVAAALVFVVGGTLLTRDTLSPRKQTTPSADTESTDEFTAGAGVRSMTMTSDYNSSANAYDADSSAEGAALYSAPAADDTQAQDKKIIRTVSVTLGTQRYDESVAALRAACDEAGGWIENSSESASSSTERRTISLTLRIPSDGLDAFLTELSGAGRMIRRTESAEDVTSDYQDTQARLDTQKALMARLQALVTTAADLSDLLALESQIADTQYAIDTLQASLNVTDRQVSYATVDVSLREEKSSDAAQDTELTLGDRVLSALKSGWEVFTGFLGDAAVFLMAALPFLAVAAAVVVIAAIIRKRKK